MKGKRFASVGEVKKRTAEAVSYHRDEFKKFVLNIGIMDRTSVLVAMESSLIKIVKN